MEGEWAFGNMEDLMKFEEGLMAYVCQSRRARCEKEFKELGADIEKLKAVQSTVPKNHLQRSHRTPKTQKPST